ncbi:MAG: TetR/AcrR family transcriptional regulator [Solirubrobacteraceae bacterium]
MGSPPNRPASRARYERRRREVIDAAASVFADRGYHATSIEQLTEATGLTRGGLYHYTASKRDLLFGVVEELMAPLLSEAAAIVDSSQSPERQLRELMRAWLRHVASHRAHIIVFSQERRTLEREPGWRSVASSRARFEQLLADVLARGRSDGSFELRDPQLALLMVLGVVNYTPQWYSAGGRLTPEQIAELYCDTLLDGVRAR